MHRGRGSSNQLEEMSEDSSATSTGTPTITSSVKARGMPYFDGSDCLYPSSGEQEEGGRMKAGRDRSKTPDTLILSLNDTDDRKKKKPHKKLSKDIKCCLHGRPCHLGIASEDSSKPEYETVKMSPLENPPASFTLRKPDGNDSSEKEEEKGRRTVYRCKYPSELSSLPTPSSVVTSFDDGTYENIEDLNSFRKSSSPFAGGNEKKIVARKESKSSSRHSRHRHEVNVDSLYIGPMCKREAEKYVKGETHFLLYHRLSSHALTDIRYVNDHVHLYFVYKNSKGDFHHYPIIRTRGPASTKQYHVDCAEPILFYSLDALINYYSVYVCVNDEGVDVFPAKSREKKKQ